MLSWTQVLLTKIVKLCSEIHDIKNSQNKYHLRKRNTRKPTINLPKTNNEPYNHTPVSLDTYASHNQHDGNSSDNTPNFPLHLSYKTNTAPPCELSPSHTLSSPTPPEGGVSHNSPLLSPSLSEDTSSSIGVSSKDTLFDREGCGTSKPIWREGGMEEIWMGRVSPELWEESELGTVGEGLPDPELTREIGDGE